MTYSPIARDSLDWDVPLNAALVDQDGRITTNTSAVATLQGQMTTVTATANGALQKTSNLSDLASASSARTNLGLGGSATLNVGTTTGTVAAGDDTRITGALQTTGGTMSGAIAMGTSKITGLGNGSAAQDAAAFGQIPTAGTGSTNYTVGNDTRLLQAYNGPRLNGYLTYNYDPMVITTTGAGANTSGTIYLHKVYLAQGQTATTVGYGIQTAGSTLTAGQNFVGLYDSSGARVAVSADQASSWTSTGYKTTNFSVAYSVTTAGFYYVAFLAVGTTPPAFSQQANASQTFYNANTSAGTFRHCSDGTAQTSLPSSITLGSTISTNVNTWVAIL